MQSQPKHPCEPRVVRAQAYRNRALGQAGCLPLRVWYCWTARSAFGFPVSRENAGQFLKGHCGHPQEIDTALRKALGPMKNGAEPAQVAGAIGTDGIFGDGRPIRRVEGSDASLDTAAVTRCNPSARCSVLAGFAADNA